MTNLEQAFSSLDASLGGAYYEPARNGRNTTPAHWRSASDINAWLPMQAVQGPTRAYMAAQSHDDWQTVEAIYPGARQWPPANVAYYLTPLGAQPMIDKSTPATILVQPTTKLRPSAEEFVQVTSPSKWATVQPVYKTKPDAEVPPTQVDIEEQLGTQNLYKTELCRSFAETGACRYGVKCQFAHGKEELRPVLRHPKYKTEICKTFHTIGTCPYGKRCRFIHTCADEANANSVNIPPWDASEQTVSAIPRSSPSPDLPSVLSESPPIRPETASTAVPVTSTSPTTTAAAAATTTTTVAVAATTTTAAAAAATTTTGASSAQAPNRDTRLAFFARLCDDKQVQVGYAP